MPTLGSIALAALAGGAAALAHVRSDPPPGESYDPPGSTVTTGRDIEVQEVGTVHADGVWASNDFDGGRMSGFEHLGGDRFRVVIRPENQPINDSAWYAFRIGSTVPRTVTVTLDYPYGRHRYHPKVFRGGAWHRVPSGDVRVSSDGTSAALTLRIDGEPLWVSAQESRSDAEMLAWAEALPVDGGVSVGEIGRSVQDRPIRMAGFGGRDPEGTILVMARQHPPEIAGTLAMQRFVETLAAPDDEARAFLGRHRVLMVPVVNPDGVAGGHWRHNARGVDLNRDWLHFNQPEVRAVRDGFRREVRRIGAPVVFAIDFHSTQEDVFFTHASGLRTNRPGLTGRWLDFIRETVPGYHVVEDASGSLGAPVSKNWFYRAFRTTAITYEVADEADRDRLGAVAEAGARALMRLLPLYEESRGRP